MNAWCNYSGHRSLLGQIQTGLRLVLILSKKKMTLPVVLLFSKELFPSPGTFCSNNPPPAQNEAVLLKKVYEQLLFSDLSEVGMPCLPPNVTQLHAEFLKGPFFLQIDEHINIGEANETRGQESNKRCLKVKISDGTQSFYGFEYRQVPGFGVDMPPGTKILLREVMMRRGLAMLQPERIDVLGGEVANPEEEEGSENQAEGGGPEIVEVA